MAAFHPAEIAGQILFIRGQRVLLDSDLARMYGVETKNLNKAVKRNADRFPSDFLFQLTREEVENLRFQTGTSNDARPQTVPAPGSGSGRGGRRYLPYAFTEQGVAMLSSVLRSPRAVAVNIEIMRAFVKLRRLLLTHAELARKLEDLEKKYDTQFRGVFDAIRALMASDGADRPYSKTKIGFGAQAQRTAESAHAPGTVPPA